MIFDTTKAEKEASKLLEKFEKSFPVDLKAIAEYLGLQIIEDKQLEDDVSGMLVIKDDTGFIVVNRGHHENRKRFTIAHEIGHFILHKSKQKIFMEGSKKLFEGNNNNLQVFPRNKEASEGIYRNEIEANAFAAELLMPKKEVCDRVYAKDFLNESVIAELANNFNVSKKAMEHRLANLKITWLLWDDIPPF
jgi:Zn-dependent peptidase ImmA (M78 family)